MVCGELPGQRGGGHKHRALLYMDGWSGWLAGCCRLLKQAPAPSTCHLRLGCSRPAPPAHSPHTPLLPPSEQVGFLTCLKEFADWLRRRGASEGGGAPMELPKPIEGDRVGGLSIKLLLQKDKNWTKALKYCLVDLKYCLKYEV